MHPVVGIFTRREAAELEPAGIDRGRIIVLTPGTPWSGPPRFPRARPSLRASARRSAP